MRKIIALAGYAQSGKDESVKVLTSLGYKRVAFADKVREGALGCNPIIAVNRNDYYEDEEVIRLRDYLEQCGGDWDKAKQHPEVRRFLQAYGTEGGRDIHGPYCWIILAMLAVGDSGKFAFSDLRFVPDEYQAIRDVGGKVIYIERPGVGPVNGHSSESHMAKLRELADYIIGNDGSLDDLRNAVELAEASLFS